MSNEKVNAIVVDGYKFPMHSDYVFDLKKVYTEEPSRTLNGSIPVFPSKLFIPYFTITYAIVPIKKYYEMMNKIQTDEQVVTYYDSFAGEYKTDKFYAQQPSIDGYIALQGEYTYVRNLKIVFAGTLNDITLVTVEYNSNGGTTAPTSQKGYMGAEFKVNSGTTISKQGYDFINWNTMADGSGQSYIPNSIASFTTNLTLYAQWQVAEYSNLSLNYGVGKPTTDESGKDITSIRVKYNNAIEGLPQSVIVFDNATQKEFVDEYKQPVYTFVGWFTLPNKEGSQISNGSIYNVQGDSSVYAGFNVKSYTITFDSRGGTECSPITGEYGTAISIPNPVKDGFEFAGWYKDLEFKIKWTYTIIKQENVTLYAKWNEKKKKKKE